MTAHHHTRRDGIKEICPYCVGATKVMTDCDSLGEEWQQVFCHSHKQTTTDSHEVSVGITTSGKVSILCHSNRNDKDTHEMFLSKETAILIAGSIMEASK